MKKGYLTLLLACLVALSVRAQTPFWTPANTEAGTVPALAATGTTVFAGTDGGGVYRSIDDGDNWAPTALQDVNVRGMAVSGSTVWAVTYGSGAYRSTDLFATAPAIAGEPANLLSIAIASTNPTAGAGSDGNIFLGTDGSGVSVSSNNGATWTAINTGLPSGAIIRSLYVEPNGAGAGLNRVWAGTHGGGLYYLNYVAGPGLAASWVAANGGDNVIADAVVHAIAIDAGGNVFAGTERGVYRSTNDGASWTLLPDPDVAGKVIRSLLIYTNGSEFILAGTDGDYLARSTTATATGAAGWTQIMGHPAPPNGLSGFQSRSILSLLRFGTNVFAGTTDRGVHRSADDGLTWDQVSAVLVNALVQAMAFDPAGRLWAGTYGFGMLMTDDFGSPPLNWTRLNKGITNRFIYAVAANGPYVFAGSWGGGVYRTNDAGANWAAVGLNGRLVYDLAISPSGQVYAATDRGEVARSVDNGLTWSEVGVASTAIWALEFESATTLYAGTFGYGVYKSTDGGATWAQTGMTSGHVFDFVITDDPDTVPVDVVLFAATATGVQRSADGGATWTDYSTGLSIVDVRALAVSGGGDLLAGTYGGGVFVRSGATWIRDGMPEGLIIALAVNPNSGEVLAGTENAGIFIRTGTTTDREEPTETPRDYVLSQNYPNPFNPSTRIEFALPQAGQVRLAVYDVLGREVRVLVDGALQAGRHDVTFDAQALPGGVYVYRLEANGQSISQQMVLMK